MNKRVNKHFKLEYDQDGDILYIARGKLTTQDISDELGDDVVVWKNKKSGEVSGFTVLNFSKRSSSKKGVELPIEVDLHPLI